MSDLKKAGGSFLSAIDDPLDFSGKKAGKAAKESGKLQAQVAREGAAESGRQFDITETRLQEAEQFRRGQIQPFQQAGVDALSQQRILLGLGESPVVDPNAQRRIELEQQIAELQGQVPQQAGQVENPFAGAGGAFGGLLDRAVSKAQQQGLAAQTEAETGRQAQLGELQSELQGFGAVPTGSGLSAQEQQAQAFQQLSESPGQQFLRKRQEKAILRNASATGGLGGGNVLNALQENAFGLAQTDIQNQFGRLGQIAGQGQAAGTNLGQGAASSAFNIGQFGQQATSEANRLRQGASEARASGILGAQQASAQGKQNLLTAGAAFLASDERLKTDIVKTGNDEFGGIYEFKYIGSDTKYSGRMAQELREIRPDAVIMDELGFLAVTAEFKPEVIAWH